MPSRYTHAGGLVFRAGPAGPEYLIVEARRSRGTWVLPKGHIEDGETAEEAAVREVQEEAGSDARVVERLGRIELASARVLFFLMRHHRDVPADEERRLKWLTCEDALKWVGFDDIRRLLKRANARIARNHIQGPRPRSRRTDPSTLRRATSSRSRDEQGRRSKGRKNTKRTKKTTKNGKLGRSRTAVRLSK